MCNPGLGPWTDSETFCCQVDISLRFAITDFIYSGDSNDHLTSVPTVSPLSRHIYYLMQQFLLLIILITKKSPDGWPESIKCASCPPIHFAKLLSNSLLLTAPISKDFIRLPIKPFKNNKIKPRKASLFFLVAVTIEKYTIT